MPVPQLPRYLIYAEERDKDNEPHFPLRTVFYITSAQEQQPEHECDNKYRRYRADNIHRAQQYAERQPPQQAYAKPPRQTPTLLFNKHDEVKEQQDKAGIQRLGEHERIEHHL